MEDLYITDGSVLPPRERPTPALTGWIQVPPRFHYPSRIVPHRDGCDPETIDVRLTGAGYTHELIEIAGQLGVRVIEGPAKLP